MSKPDSPPGNSRAVTSSQPGPHPRLGELVRKHLDHTQRHPVASHTLEAFAAVRSQVETSGRPLVFDSFCGTGMSTAILAREHPEALVIGIDKSAHRLSRHSADENNHYLLLQAECYDFWRLAANAGWSADAHYIFYPNPWPKPGHLQRRVQGSSALPFLLALGGQVELRSNWRLYAEEFGLALAVAGHHPHIDLLTPAQPVSLFERKYLQSRHQLWRCRCQLGHNNGPD